ncbi:protein Aster-B-like [Tachypleus tridentatus]|uniref:protein Aster-B-like n=1 Tax=Tachypleus tridentatus TaxID=6853 RepID=UPI003FD5F377
MSSISASNFSENMELTGASGNTNRPVPIRLQRHWKQTEEYYSEFETSSCCSQTQLQSTRSSPDVRTYSPKLTHSEQVHSSPQETSVDKVLAGSSGRCIASPTAVPSGGSSADNTNWQDSVSRSSESGKSVDWTVFYKQSEVQNREVAKSDRSSKGSDKKKKSSSWYNVLNPTYKSRSDDFKRLFRDLPESERLIVDYSCALQKDILVHGRLYVSENYFCFYANIFRWETFLLIQCRDITSMTKEKTARVIPNAVQICTDNEKHFFTSFAARDKAYLMLFRIWQNALLETPMSSQEIWQWVHHSYGEVLGLTSDDEDYVPPLSQDDEHKTDNSLVGVEVDETLKEDGCTSEKYETASATTHDVEEFSVAVTTETLQQSDVCEPLEMETVEGLQQVQNIIPAGKVHSSQLPTDFSDTTESGLDDIGEIPCMCSTHDGKEMMNCIIPLPIDQVFTLVFTGSKFFHDLLTSRKTFNIMESPWQLCGESGHKMRQVTYTLTLNHSMAKTAQTTETQRLLKHSKPGQLYVIVCDVVNTGIPYSDTFSVKSHYCLTKVTNGQCRLRVCGSVYYKKSVWGLVKSLIEKSAVQGLQDFCADLEAALNKEADLMKQQSIKKPRRRKRTKLVEFSKADSHNRLSRSLHTQTTGRKLSVPYLSGMESESFGYTSDFIIRVILATLVVLLLLNILLFYKLWSLDDETLEGEQANHRVFDVPLESLEELSQDDWINLLKKHEVLYQIETEKWKDVLTEIIKVTKIMETSLTDLKSSIELYSSVSLFNTASFTHLKESPSTSHSFKKDVLTSHNSDENLKLHNYDKETSSYVLEKTERMEKVPQTVSKEHQLEYEKSIK